MDIYHYSPERTERNIENGYELTISDYFKNGYEIFKKDFGGFVAYALLVLLIMVVLEYIPVIGSVASLLIQSPLLAGFLVVARRINFNQSHTFSDFFKGFKYFVPLVLANLVGGILIAIGLVLLILPGVYLIVAYTLAVPYIVFAGMDFWPALETSRRLINKNWFRFLGLLLLILLLNLGGALFFGVGLLITVPISFCVLYAVYEHLIGTGGNTDIIEEAVIVEE
jgi:uncharacterized membrane protein